MMLSKAMVLSLIFFIWISCCGVFCAQSSRQQQQQSSSSASSTSSSCGTTKPGVVFRRIIGGRKALKSEFPYQVALEKRSFWNPSYRQFCGASIIDDRWILTAAHCTAGESANYLRAVGGVTDLTASDGNAVEIEKIMQHESYNSWTVQNDIALLKTKSPIRTSMREFTNSICLPAPKQEFNGTGHITGFGLTREGGSATSQHLLAAPLDILPDSACTNAYGWEFKAPGMLCAGLIKGGRDTCQGDSGGPLAVKSGSGYTLVGITSFGRGCGRANTPGVYTRVSQYVDWITDKIKNN